MSNHIQDEKARLLGLARQLDDVSLDLRVVQVTLGDSGESHRIRQALSEALRGAQTARARLSDLIEGK